MASPFMGAAMMTASLDWQFLQMARGVSALLLTARHASGTVQLEAAAVLGLNPLQGQHLLAIQSFQPQVTVEV